MTSMRPLVIPAAALALAAVAPSAQARPRKVVTSVWVSSPGPALPTVVGDESDAHALSVQAATTLPVAARALPEGTAVPGGCYSAAAAFTGTAAAGRPTTATARGPPV
jgi:hypothetical protein